ncbi:cytochrome P450 monooxygenase [Fusarium globosum]|uniref:Cytochrome P450 monooxygenase n=1 Tax=Fusarium globosum TaxID=78864 RepID=A0A8H6D4P1_9HYPO|nr:cytochrome P450 monooxygenase [Fusarium globosum]
MILSPNVTVLFPAYVLAAVLIGLVVKGIYNVFFHPLRSYPGPFLARATRLYQIYWDLQGVMHTKTKELHDQYGGTVRIAPDELSYNTAQAWRDICGHRTKGRVGSFEKDRSFFNQTVNGADHIQIAGDNDHRRMRRLQSHAFSEKALRSQEDLLQKYVDLLMQQLHQRAANPTTAIVDMVRWFNFTTFDVIGDLAFGESFGCLEEGILHRWITGIFSLVRSGNWIRAARRFPPPLNYLGKMLIPRHLLEERKYQFIFSRDKVNRRVEQDTERSDFMSYILQANDEKGMSIDELYVGASFLIIAGSETTATLLSGATYLLLTNPPILETLKQEIRSSFTDEADINLQNTAPLTYLNAVLEESLRMYPPVPSTFPRQTPLSGEVICGQFVKGGTSVGIHQWSTFRSAENFHDPDVFHPERWLGDPRFAADQKDAFQPFSHGPRNCLGRNLAYAEMRLILARLLWNFDLELQPKCKNWIADQKTYSLWQKVDLDVKLVPVKR